MPEQLAAILAKWITVKTASSALVEHKIAPVSGINLSALTTFNTEEGIRRIGGKVDAYRKQLYRFRDRYANAATELQHLVEKQGLTAAEAYCHALKGVSGNLGANELFAYINEIDQMLKQNRSPSTEHFAKLHHLVQQSMTEIDNLTAVVAEPMTESTTLHHDELLAKLGALTALLDNDLGAAGLLLDDLQIGVQGTEIEPDIQEIVRKVDIFEIDDAINKTNALYNKLHQYK